MVDVKELIVCPVCHSGLPLQQITGEQSACCSGCQRSYGLNEGVYNMTPLPPPAEVSPSRWKTWQQLQDNGLVAYTAAPELNLSIGSRNDAKAFKSFCAASGLILDVGCGPQSYPSYLSAGEDVVGIDPLLGVQPRSFAFVQGISEYLPFRENTFDHVLYATSLDHTLDPASSLLESARCLKVGGLLSLWLDAQAASHSSPTSTRWQRYRMLAKKGFKTLSRHGTSKMGLRRTLSYVGVVAEMSIPQGAIDYFHFEHLTSTTVSSWLSGMNLEIVKREEFEEADSLFLQVRKGVLTDARGTDSTGTHSRHSSGE